MAQLFEYCKKAALPSLSGGDPVEAQVSIGPNGGLLLEVPYEFDYPVNTQMEVDFLDPIMGMVTCLAVLHSPLVKKGRITRSYRCNVLRRIRQMQRREDVKVPVFDVVSVRLNDAEEETQATLRNISAGGVLLVTSLRALPGERLNFTFQCDGLDLPLTAEILRAEPEKGRRGETLFAYGCRFIQLSSAHESALRSFVYQVERMLYSGK